MNLGNFFKFALLSSTLLLSACDKDPVVPNEEEVITTLKYVLEPEGGSGVPVTLLFQDLDGDGGAAPLISSSALQANKTYIGTLTLSNEQAVPTVDITQEVAAEKEAHQFFFESTVANTGVTYDDVDANGDPVGIKSKLTTGAASTGKLTIILRHEPDKGASGVAQGNITNAGGETDISVTFDVTVQ